MDGEGNPRVNDIVLRDIDATLLRRIEQVASRHGWSLPETLGQLLEAGLVALGAHGAQVLDQGEDEALVRAIAAMERLPNDPGFALIGREPKP